MHRPISIIALFIVLASAHLAMACESCTIPRLGREKSKTAEVQDKWFVEYLYEEQNWDEMDAQEAHELHHDGHHVHDKTVEQFQHLMIGYHPVDELTFFAEIPHVTRRSIEVDSHAILGSTQISKGLGDLTAAGHYQFWENETASLGAVGGVKFPTGNTGERNSIGIKFEPEMQSGTGSFDYITGAVYRQKFGNFGLLGNIAYVFKTKGGQDFEHGDLFSVTAMADYLINPKSEFFRTKIALDVNLQHAQKQKDRGVKVFDSGGTTLLMGPLVTIEGTKNVLAFGSVQFPVSQRLGGIHQELDFVWTAGGKVLF